MARARTPTPLDSRIFPVYRTTFFPTSPWRSRTFRVSSGFTHRGRKSSSIHPVVEYRLAGRSNGQAVFFGLDHEAAAPQKKIRLVEKRPGGSFQPPQVVIEVMHVEDDSFFGESAP